MRRRTFLRNTGMASAPMILGGFPVTPAGATGNHLLDMLAQTAYGCGKTLVIVQMNGGNDALNMVFPRDKWANLVNARGNILMQENQTLALNNNSSTSLHPAMSGMRDMYNDGKMMIVQGVSYPNPNFSHFRATDIWFSASNSNQVLDTGWLGRSLDTQYPGFPTAFPNSDMPDPLAIQIGSTLPFSLQGPSINMGYNVSDPNALLNVINGITDPAPNNDYGREISFLRLMKDQSNAYRTVIQTAYNVPVAQPVTYPSPNSLADQLKIVARLINGGLKTPVYIVNHPNSHDTHEDQVNTTDKTTGTHANLLGILSAAVTAFQKDIKAMGKEKNVTGMTYSEFGRRIKSNASLGTDHGAAAPVMFFGAALNTNPNAVIGTSNPVPGMIGTSPNLPANATVNDQVPMQYDFRQLYASVMRDWFCLSESQTNSVLGNAFTTLPIFANQNWVDVKGIELVGQYLNGVSKLSYRVNENQKFVSFNVEFSANGIDFTSVSTKQNMSLNTAETYYFDHEINAKRMYYRVAGKDHNNAITYSNMLDLLANAAGQWFSIYPNPITNATINIKFFELPDDAVDVNLYTMAGQKMYSNRFRVTGSLLSFRVPVMTANAHYILEVSCGSLKSREQVMFR